MQQYKTQKNCETSYIRQYTRCVPVKPTVILIWSFYSVYSFYWQVSMEIVRQANQRFWASGKSYLLMTEMFITTLRPTPQFLKA